MRPLLAYARNTRASPIVIVLKMILVKFWDSEMVKIGSFWGMTSKNSLSARFMDINLAKNVINVVNLVKISHF